MIISFICYLQSYEKVFNENNYLEKICKKALKHRNIAAVSESVIIFAA